MADVLIVDDDPASRQYLSTLLGYAGHRIEQAGDGETALERVRACHPDLVIADIVMPDMDGYDFVRRVREDAQVAQTPVIFYSAVYYEDEARQLAGKCGVGQFLVKPADPEVILATIGRALEGRTRPLEMAPEFNHEHSRLLTGKLRESLEDLAAANESLREHAAALEKEVADRKEAQRALRASERKFAMAFFDNAAAMLITERSDGKLLEANESFLRLTGYSRAEVLGHLEPEIRLWIQPASRTEWLDMLRAEGAVRQKECRFRTHGGEVRIGVASAEPIELERTECLLWTLWDITEQRRLEEQLQQAQKLEAIGRLAGGVAHDFNNLLAAIIGFTELALGDIGTPGRGDPAAELGHVLAAADRARRLVQQLLAFSRQQPVQAELVDLNRVIADLHGLLQPPGQEGEPLLLALESEPCPVKVDRTQIEQVILNLVVNARDAVAQGGTITLGTRRQTADGGEPRAVLFVSDTGRGMDAETVRRACDPFFTTKEVGKGTGLGLSIVYGIAKQNGGSVEIESEPGRGTMVQVSLPLANEPLAAAESAAARGQGTILLVEDDELTRASIRRMLERQGYSVCEATDGDQAFHMASDPAVPIDLLVSDLAMPGLSGGELARRLREIRPGLRVLFVTGCAERPADLPPGLPCLSKPFTLATLSAAVRAACGQ